MLKKLKNRRIRYKLKENTIEALREELGLKGDGTQESPLILENFHNINVEITLRTKSIYVILRRVIISKLSIIDSENVTVRHCGILELEITSCRNINFVDNQIDYVKQLLCRGCNFEGNSILIEEKAKLINNAYERRTFIFVWICLSASVFLAFCSVVSLAYLYISLDSVILSLAGISLSITMMHLLILRFRLKSVPPNKFDSDSTPEVLDVESIFEKSSTRGDVNI